MITEGDELRMGCISCPICESIVVLSTQESNLHRKKLDEIEGEESTDDRRGFTHICIYKCGYCEWNSIDDLGIYSKLHVETSLEGSSEKEMMAKAAKEVQIQLSNMMKARQGSGKPLVFNLMRSWNEKLKMEETGKRKAEMLVSTRQGGGTTTNSTSIANVCTILNTKDLNAKKYEHSTSIASVDNVVNKKREHITRQVNNSLLSEEENPLRRLTTAETSGDVGIDDIISTPTISVRQSTISTTNIQGSTMPLLPIFLSFCPISLPFWPFTPPMPSLFLSINHVDSLHFFRSFDPSNSIRHI